MTETVEMNVVMHCEGCAATVRKTLKRIPGTESYTVNFAAQRAVVVGKVDPDDVLKRVLKSGKVASLVATTPVVVVIAAVPEPPKEAPKAEDAKKESEIKKEEAKPAEDKKQEKKEGRHRFSSLRQKMPDLKMPKMPKMGDAKMPKMPKMPDLKNLPDCRNLNMPKFINHACSEFMSKGVFYAASDGISDAD